MWSIARLENCRLGRLLSLAGAAASKNFVMANVSRQDKTCLLSQQKYASFCHDKTFVATSLPLSWQTHVCCDETFVATTMILAAAPTSDSFLVVWWVAHSVQKGNFFSPDSLNTPVCLPLPILVILWKLCTAVKFSELLFVNMFFLKNHA